MLYYSKWIWVQIISYSAVPFKVISLGWQINRRVCIEEQIHPKKPPYVVQQVLGLLEDIAGKKWCHEDWKKCWQKSEGEEQKAIQQGTLTQEFSIFPPCVLFRRDACTRENWLVFLATIGQWWLFPWMGICGPPKWHKFFHRGDNGWKKESGWP